MPGTKENALQNHQQYFFWVLPDGSHSSQDTHMVWHPKAELIVQSDAATQQGDRFF